MTSAGRGEPQGRARGWTLLTRVTVGVVSVSVSLPAVLVATLYLQAQRTPGGEAEYVALGSSFAAAPGVGSRVGESPTACLRSDDNYPQRVAEALELSLTDVSCSGATVEHVLEGGQYFLPPQVDALKPETRLVTVTIGGNDVAFLGNLTGWACRSGELSTPVDWKLLGACDVTSDAAVNTALDRLPDALRRVVATIRERAPRAEVVLLDYQAVLPDVGTCRPALPLTDVQMERARTVQVTLNRTIREVAQAERVGWVSAHAATIGHDVCSTDPWISPYEFPSTLLSFGSVPYHPTDRGVAATARAIETHVRARR